MGVVIVFGLGIICANCRGWSVRGSRDPPRSTQSLIDHLRRGPSRVNNDVSVVPLTENECGFQWTGVTANRVAQVACSGEREVVAFVDRTEFVAPHCGRDTAVGQAVEAYLGAHENVRRECSNALPSMYIAIFLSLTRRGIVTGGRFAPYLETLPSLSNLQHLPIFWNWRELAELQSSAVKAAVQQRKDDWEQEFDIVRRAIKEDVRCHSNFVDCQTWFWARSIITSRAFKDEGEPCLVPYVDMMNHAVAQAQDDVIKCTWNIDSSGFRLVMPDEYNVGMATKRAELSYGAHSNSNFLLNYGFSVPNNVDQVIYDKAFLSLTLPVDTDYVTEALWEADGLGDCHTISRNVTVSIGDPGPMQSLLSLCRVASSEGLELGHMQGAFVEEGATTTQTVDGLIPQLGATLCRSPFSVPNEIRAMEMLQKVASDCLRRYGTTLAADDELLQEGLNWKQRWFGRKQHMNRVKNAITVRRAEKQVIHHFYNMASLALRFLNSQEDVDLDLYKGMLDVALESEELIVDFAA